jgi:citrate synthase
MELYAEIASLMEAGSALTEATDAVLRRLVVSERRLVPGFGHRFHPIDPRTPRLLSLVAEAKEAGVVEGRVAAIGGAVEDWLAAHKSGRRLPMNVDGVTAVVYAELGFAPVLGRALFVLSRSIGIMSHAWEQMQQGGRIKGPLPPSIPYTYEGPLLRRLGAEQ